MNTFVYFLSIPLLFAIAANFFIELIRWRFQTLTLKENVAIILVTPFALFLIFSLFLSL